jgi:uncharacterized membrane protein YphA (DoxX/SURF4 family)
MFPRGGPGFALLLLRISVAATLLLSLAGRPDPSLFHLLFAGAVLVSIALAIGIFTPVVSSIVCVYAILELLIGLRFDTPLVSLILNSIALALLGPGAYSLDARWFGLKVMVMSPRKDASGS